MKILLALIAGLGLGFAAGFFLGQDLDQTTQETVSISPPPEKTALEQVEARGDGEGGTPLLTAIQSIDPIAVPKGSGVITGEVLTRTGDPVVNAKVTAVANRKSNLGEDSTLEDRVRNYVQGQQWKEQSRKETKTDEEGNFRLTGLADLEYRIDVTQEGFEFSRRGQTYRVKPGGTARFVATPIIEVQANVFLPDGSQATAATIDIQEKTANGTRGHRDHDWTPKNRTLRLSPGNLILTAVGGPDKVFRSSPTKLKVTLTTSPRPLKFQLESKPGIRGRVIMPRGMEADHFRVYAMAFSQGKEPDPKLLMGGKNDWASQWEDYAFEFTDLTPGTYLIGASSDRETILGTARVEVTNSLVIQDIRIAPPDQENSVVLWVLNPQGGRMDGVDIEAGMQRYGSYRRGDSSAFRQTDGSYLVRIPEPEDSMGGFPGLQDNKDEFFLRVRSAEFGEKMEFFSRENTREATIQFEEPVSLTVQVQNYEGSDYEGRLELNIKSMEESQREASYVMIYQSGNSEEALDSTGKQTFHPLQKGSYEVALSLKKDRYNSTPIALETVTAMSGENFLNISIPPLYPLTLFFEESASGGNVQLSASGGGPGRTNQQAKIGEDGRAEFQDLPPGKYQIVTFGRGVPELMTVRIPDQREVRFEAQIVNALEVTIEDPEGTLAQAGLQTGDLILGIEGKRFENLMQMQTLLMSHMNKETGKMTIRRGGQEQEFEINLKILAQSQMGGPQGGRIEPATVE